jgi:hypothetical protein
MCYLTLVAGTGGLSRLFAGAGKHGEQDSGQNGNYGNHD